MAQVGQASSCSAQWETHPVPLKFVGIWPDLGLWQYAVIMSLFILITAMVCVWHIDITEHYTMEPARNLQATVAPLSNDTSTYYLDKITSHQAYVTSTMFQNDQRFSFCRSHVTATYILFQIFYILLLTLSAFSISSVATR